MSATIIPLPWPKPPLSLNDRPSHPKARAREVREVREAAAAACAALIAKGALDVLEPVTVTLVWFAPDHRKRDADNPVATLKPLCDGLADAGLVPDDTPEWMDKRPVQIIYRKGEPGVELHIERRAEVIERAARALYAAMWLDRDAGEVDDRSPAEVTRQGAIAVLEAAGWFASLPRSV